VLAFIFNVIALVILRRFKGFFTSKKYLTFLLHFFIEISNFIYIVILSISYPNSCNSIN